MNYTSIQFDIRDNVAYITLNRPEAANVFDDAFKVRHNRATEKISSNN